MLQISQLTFDAYGRRFFDKASFKLPPRTRAGLVGLNGAGKSTLFKLILRQLHPGDGEISLPRNWRVGTVDQEIAASPMPLIDAVLERDKRRDQLMKALETADPMQQGEIHADLLAINADRAPARAAEILSGLGFSNRDLKRPISEFSGGWRMRASLAGALLAEPELLLLDEPTNYLDLEGALWLEARLKRYPHSALIISHDRDLLDACVGMIVHLTSGRLDSYTGNYGDFERLRAERARQNQSARDRQEAERAHLQAFVDRFRAKASKAAQAQSRLKRLEKLVPVSLDSADQAAPFLLPSPEKALAPPIVQLTEVEVGYGQTPILKKLNLRIDPEDRIGILGINGAGKSTLAKLLAGALTAQSGNLHCDRRLKVGWFHQHQIEALDPESTPIDIMRSLLPNEPESRIRARLGSFGMTVEKAETRCRDLSGGERARLLLNRVAAEAPHLLILDEPTNHLDIDSRRALLDALNTYSGAVAIITHDRSLMEMVADRLWLVDNGTVARFDQSLEDYARLVVDKARRNVSTEDNISSDEILTNTKSASAPTLSAKDARRQSADNRARLAPLKRALETLEKQIETCGTKIALVDQKLADPDLYVRDPAQVTRLTKDRGELVKAQEHLEGQWLEACEAYESAQIAEA